MRYSEFSCLESHNRSCAFLPRPLFSLLVFLRYTSQRKHSLTSIEKGWSLSPRNDESARRLDYVRNRESNEVSAIHFDPMVTPPDRHPRTLQGSRRFEVVAKSGMRKSVVRERRGSGPNVTNYEESRLIDFRM